MWRPKTAARFLEPYDLIRSAERERLQAKWRLFQAKRQGCRHEDIAAIERDVEYYDVMIPQWRAMRAETEAQRERMLRAAQGCVEATNAAVSAMRTEAA